MKNQFDRRSVVSSITITLLIIIAVTLSHRSKKNDFARHVEINKTFDNFVANTEMTYKPIPQADTPLMAAGALKIVGSLAEAISTLQHKGMNSFSLAIYGFGMYSTTFSETSNDLIREYKVTLVTHDKADEEPKTKTLTIQHFGLSKLTKISLEIQTPKSNKPVNIVWEQNHITRKATLSLTFKEGVTDSEAISAELAWDILIKNIGRTRQIFAFHYPIEKELLGQRN